MITDIMTNLLEVRLIGELEVLRDGNAIALPASKKSRALLAYLVATSKPQLRDRLCELLWDGPDDPRAALRWSLTKLRPLLDDDDAQRLIADRDRVEFSASGAHVDLHELRELTSRGVGALTSDDLTKAATLIRGELLDGLDLANCYRYQQWCAGEREALRQLHIRILGRLADVLPPGDEALGFARRRVSVDPFNEDAHIAIMRLLAAMDRNHDALRHYDDCRAMFERELGCRPSNALEDSRRAIGRTQPARVAAPPPPAAVDAGSDDSFIGREAELHAVDEAIQAVFDQKKARVLVIKGEPGIGKSRLLAELRRRAETRGATTLYGRAFAAEMVRPYGVWVDALRSVIHEVPDDARRDLAPLFPELGASGDAHDRSRLFDAVTRSLMSIAARGCVVALDDVQWLDDASAALLHFVARATSAAPVLIVCAARSGEIEDNVPAWRVLRELSRETSLPEISLEPLTAEETKALAASVSSDADIDRVSTESGGNPLFAIELARAKESHHGSLLEIIGDRLSQLDVRARELVPWAAALGRRFDVDILGRATAMPSGEMLAALERLERASVLRGSTIAAEHCYDFTHDLIREAAYQRVTGPRRWLVHRQIAVALQAMHDPDGALAGEIVHHATLAGDNDVAASAAVTAGQRCLRFFAYTEAMAVANHGLRLAESLPDDKRIPLQIELLYVIVLCRTSLSHDRRELFPRVEAVMQEAKRAGLPAAAAIGSQLMAILHEEHQSFGAGVDALRQSVEWSRGVDPATEVFAVSNTARCLLLIQRDVDRAEELIRDAQALSTRAHVEHTELPLALGYLHAHRGDYNRASYFLERALELSGRDQDHWREWVAMNRLVTIALEQGDAATALLYCQRLDPITAKMSGGSEGPRAAALHALAQLLAGEREEIDSSLEVLRMIDSKGDLAVALNFFAQYSVDRGEAAAAESAALEALAAAQEVDRPSDAALARTTLAGLEARRGGDTNARAILEPALDSSRWSDLTLRAQQAVLRCASMLDIPTEKEKPHGDHGSRTVV